MISHDLARRIDRFSWRAHAFHRYAHHPLCPAYRSEVVALGRWRLCRGCLLAGAGFATGLGLALAGTPMLMPPVASAALLGLWGGWLLVLGRLRLPKVASRFLPAALGAFLAGQGPLSDRWSGWFIALVVLGGIFAFIRAYRHRGPNRAPCQECPERTEPRVCTGFRRQTRRERAFQRVVAGWLHPRL